MQLYKIINVLIIIVIFLSISMNPTIYGKNNNVTSLEKNRNKYFYHLSEKNWDKSFLGSGEMVAIFRLLLYNNTIRLRK